MGLYVGIDLGTSSLKTCLVGEDGTLVASASRAYEPLHPHSGWREMDPELWWDACRDCLGELLAGGVGASVRGIGVTGQMHSTVFVGADGRSVRPAILWNDARTDALVASVREALDGLCHGYLARIASCGSPALNLAWLLHEEPDRFVQTERFVIGPDWIVYKLTGVLGTDFCEASTSALFDLEGCCWSSEACRALGIPESVLPEVRGSACPAGALRPELASELGIPEGVCVCVGTGDNPAAAIPTGCLATGVPVLSLGTSGVLTTRREMPLWGAAGKNILFSFDGRRILTLVQGVVQSCGGTYDWWCRRIMGLTSVSEADVELGATPLGSNELLFYPHVAGEKTLYADSSLRGAFVGLSLDTTRADMTLAVMEGIAFGVRQLVDAMRLDLGASEVLPVVGGGAKSRVWMRVLANVLGVPCAQMRGDASAGFGAALLAMLCVGSIDEYALGFRAAPLGERFEPEAAACQRYDQNYERYLRLHDALKQVGAACGRA